MRAAATLAVIASLAAVLPAAADGGHHGRRDHGRHGGWQQDAAAGYATQTTGGTVNIVQNGNQNGVAVVAGGGTTNIAQNGNNNNLTVLQVNLGGRGGRGGRPYGWRGGN